MKPNKLQFKVDGETHVVDEHDGKFKVHHPNGDGTYTLPNVHSLKAAEDAVKDWHKENG